ncbi:39S ribosomal protein L1, mitochondrial [Protobothrops mucrosquamatus]|uniref:39S ribosomal protein L1, mitochondrial n=1 Tax=Protobothrops mucrosquamatus TaxID=103944 RepID=UPI000775F111|nr:39S ribosomal protein L1, mitochondrial [Protobothrops mucrosquamatus]
MALPVVRCSFQKVFVQNPSHILSRFVRDPAVVPCYTNLLVPSRKYAAKVPRKYRRASQEKKKASELKEKDDRYKLPLPLEPKDDVYLTWCYQKQIYDTEAALELLKKFQPLDFTPATQELYAHFTLNMASEKKKTMGPFFSTLLLPYRFTDVIPKILVFTQDPKEADLASEHGAAIVGGVELINPILNEEIGADFYIAAPEITTKINPLRNFLKQKYPSMKNGTITYNIAETLNFFKACHEYSVTDDNLIQTPFAMLDMPNDEILANLDSIIKDICKHKSSKYGPFVTSMSIRSSTSEALDVKVEAFLSEESLGRKLEETERISEEEKQEPDD